MSDTKKGLITAFASSLLSLIAMFVFYSFTIKDSKIENAASKDYVDTEIVKVDNKIDSEISKVDKKADKKLDEALFDAHLQYEKDANEKRDKQLQTIYDFILNNND